MRAEVPPVFQLSRLALALATLSLVSPALAGLSIEGEVERSGGRPLPGAVVTLWSLADVEAESFAVGAFAEQVAEAPRAPAATTRSDERGRFRMEAPGAGMWVVRVAADGFVPIERRLTPLLSDRLLPVARLQRDQGRSVRAVDDDGPIAGATVRATHPAGRFGALEDDEGWTVAPRIGTTDADGNVELPAAAGARDDIALAAVGRVPLRKRGVRSRGVTLTLAAGRPHHVVVEDPDGRTVEGVLIAADGVVVAVTDGRGKATIRRDAADDREVALWRRDAAGWRRSEALLGGTTRAEEPQAIVFPAPREVVCRVIDRDSREPIVGAVVWATQDPRTSGVTTPGGTVALRGSQAEILGIVGGAPGYLSSTPLSFTLLDDGRPGPTLALARAAEIEGVVVDGNGRPIEGAELSVEVRRPPGEMRIEIGGGGNRLPRAQSDALGRFVLGPLDAAQNYTVETVAEGYARRKSEVGGLDPRDPGEPLRIALGRGERLRGSVVDPAGTPIAGATLEIRPAPKRRGMGPMMMGGGNSAPSVESASGPDGRFEAVGLPAGEVELTVRRRGFGTESFGPFELVSGEGADAGELVLEPGVTIEGSVLDSDGRPVEDAEIRLADSGKMGMRMPGGPASTPADALTDANGWFRLFDLKEGRKVDLSVERTGFVARSVKAVAPPTIEPLEVRLEAASTVSGIVLDEAGEPIGGAQVTLQRTKTMEIGNNVMQMMMAYQSQSDAAGRFRFTEQEPGRITLSAEASGYQKRNRSELEIPRGEDLTDVELVLPVGSVVEGQVLTPDGRPAIGAKVGKVGEGMRFGMGGQESDGNGYFRIEGLEPGSVSIEATHDDYPRTVKDVDLDPGINPLRLRFEGGFAVSGRVVDEAGRGVPAAVVRLTAPGEYFGGHEKRAEADGSFELPGVRDGRYELWVHADGFAPHPGETEVEVAGSSVEGLEVRLDEGGTILGRVRGIAEERYERIEVRAYGKGVMDFEGRPLGRGGSFRIEELPPNRYELIAVDADTGRQAKGSVELEPGVEEVRVDLQFEEGVTLSGTVVEGDAPVVGAFLHVEGQDVEHSATTTTERDGSFSVEGLEPGRYLVRVQNFDTGLHHAEEVDVATSRRRRIEIPTATVVGRVVDQADRSPLPGVTITLDPSDQAPRFMSQKTAISDIEGRFTLRNVADGDWRLGAERDGYAAIGRDLSVQFERGGPDLRLEMEPTEGLRLEALDPAGNPPTSVQLAVLDAAGAPLVQGRFSTGENGSVRLTTVPRGRWNVVIGADGSATSTLPIDAPGGPIPIRLQPATALLVTVPELVGSGLRATATIASVDGSAHHSLDWAANPRAEWRLADGRRSFGSLPPGAWRVVVTASDGRSWQAEAQTAPGAPAEVTLE